jgi:hypothetical protein
MSDSLETLLPGPRTRTSGSPRSADSLAGGRRFWVGPTADLLHRKQTALLFDDLVGECEQRRGHRNSQRSGSLQIYTQR